MERREWTSGELSGTCVIWCKGFPFWHLVKGVSLIKVEGIWGEYRRWRRQAHRWWPDTKWREGEKEKDALCWKVDWILTEEGQLHKMESEFLKISKGKVMFISGKRSLPVPLVRMYQRMRVLHRRSGGSTDRAHNVVLLTKNEIDIRRMELEAT